MFTEKFSRMNAIHPGIFHEQALWADSVSLRMNTIAPCDQFKPIEGLCAKRVYISFWADFHFLQDRASFWQTDLFFLVRLRFVLQK